MRSPRTGLTLIELVAALTLLAMIVTASLPILHRAAAALPSSNAAITVEDLGLLADRLLDDPGAFGIGSLQAIEIAEVEWPSDPSHDAYNALVIVELVDTEDGEHAWLRFSAAGVSTLRWVKPEDKP